MSKRSQKLVQDFSRFIVLNDTTIAKDYSIYDCKYTGLDYTGANFSDRVKNSSLLKLTKSLEIILNKKNGTKQKNENLSFKMRRSYCVSKNEMKKLCDYLDSNLIRIFLYNGRFYTGIPIDVNYADESKNGEDQITIEDPDISMRFHTFSQSEIKNIKKLD